MSTSKRIDSVGLGWDLHRLEPGRVLMLCGVEVPFEKGLVGHSDADVALHAVIDALLGAAGLGDIGEMFPSEDRTWAGADSGDLLSRTMQAVSNAQFAVVNVDVTIVAQQPRLGPYKPLMRKRLAELLGIPVDAANVKAKTSDHVGAPGRGEAVVAYAIAGLCRVDTNT